MLIVPVYPSGIPTDAEYEAEFIGHGGGDGLGNMIQWQTYHPAQWHNKNKGELIEIAAELGIKPAGGFASVASRLNRLLSSGSAAPTTGTHYWGDMVFNSAPTAGGFIGWCCTDGGTSDAINAVGDITSGEYALTISSGVADLVVGQFIDIAGVTGPQVILAIDDPTVTVHLAADATVTGAAVTEHTPTWKTFGVISS